MNKLKKIDPGIYQFPVILPAKLESKQVYFKNLFIEAQKQLRIFAEQYKWKHLTNKPFIERAEIFDSQQDLKGRICEILDISTGTKFPEAFSACLEEKIFLSITPDLYHRIYPQGREKDDFLKLIIHEMAHRLHIRILEDNEEKMGPIWFFEAFAIFASDQFSNYKLTKSEIQAIIHKSERGSYQKYGAVIRYLLKKCSLHELIKKAADRDFIEWLEINCFS